jgi:TonB family protein
MSDLVDGGYRPLIFARLRLNSRLSGTVWGFLIVAVLWLARTAFAQSAISQSESVENGLLIVSARKIAATGQTLRIRLRSGDDIEVPAEDANERATEIVRAALRSQSPRLHLTPPENVVVLNVAAVTQADNHGRVTVTLLSGASIQCRVEDIRSDPHLVFLRTILAEEISKATAARAARQAATASSQKATPGPTGPSFQFDAKGADFSRWLRVFRAQMYRNWLVPYAAMHLHGHATLRVTIHRDGAITDLTIVEPSTVEAFTKASFNALKASDPTPPLPPDYPDETIVMTVTFYYNERPPE